MLSTGKKKKAGKEIETKRIRGWESVLKRDEGVNLGYTMYPLQEERKEAVVVVVIPEKSKENCLSQETSKKNTLRRLTRDHRRYDKR